jgi:hypothetical protein
MDYFAAISMGVYPTPGATGAQRSAYVASYGLLDGLSEMVLAAGGGCGPVPFIFMRMWR